MILAMFLFSLSMSISPGPVNLISMNTASLHGLRFSLLFVSGATLGFIFLLFLIGVAGGLLSQHIEQFAHLLRYPGAMYMLYLAWLVYRSGEVKSQQQQSKQGFLSGAFMQFVNPKAWIASLAGVSGFVIGKSELEFALFLGIYCVVCFLSITLWAWAGSVLMRKLQNKHYRRTFNLCIAAMLIASALSLLL